MQKVGPIMGVLSLELCPLAARPPERERIPRRAERTLNMFMPVRQRTPLSFCCGWSGGKGQSEGPEDGRFVRRKGFCSLRLSAVLSSACPRHMGGRVRCD